MWNKILITGAITVLPAVTMAAATITNPVAKDIKSVSHLFEVILKGITFIAIPIIVLALMWVGFKFVSAQGDPTKVSAAKTSLMLVLAGTAIILGANVILDVVTDTAQELIK